MVANPVSPSAAVLVLTLPGIWLAGRSLARVATADLWLSRLTAPGLSLALWLLATHVAGLLSGSFVVGLWTGSLVVAAAGHVLGLLRVGHEPTVGWTPGRGMWIATLATTALIARVAFGYHIHDDLFYTGHMSMTAAIQNGSYPPGNLSFPWLELRYHFGFDLLNAAVTSVFRLPVDVGVDVITLLCWAWFFMLLWAAGERVLGRGRGWITAFTVSFAGGIPFLCLLASDSFAEVLVGACSTGGTPVNPAVVSYFFQHPWTIGLPLALTLGFVFGGPAKARVRYPLLALLLVALSLSQVALFAALAAALIAAEAWNGAGWSTRRGGAMLLTSLAAVLIASRLGGFFASWPGATIPLGLTAGIADGAGPAIAWHMASFGFVLPLGLWGLLRAPRGWVHTLLICLVAGSLLLINVVEYRQSWDIVKFGNIGMIGLAAGASFAIARLIDGARKGLAIVAFGTVGMGAAGFLLALALRLPGLPGYLTGVPVRLDADDSAVASWLRQSVEPADVVYRARPADAGYAQWAGLPQFHLDAMAPRLGFPTDMLAARTRLLNEPRPDLEGLRDAGVRWLVLEPADSTLATQVEQALGAGEAAERLRSGELRVVELIERR